ncbi:hypothetical protein ACQPYE_37340 [Actinosynnema sp. CA-299493]
MSNDDKRRRQDGSTAKLSVADLLARREAETQPIPRITDRTTDGGAAGRAVDSRAVNRAADDEETVRFSVAALSAAAGAKNVTNLSGRELHITELLRREGRAGEEERGGGGFSVPKLVAMASGGVVLAGTVAFTATNLMSSPDERPLAEVRFDARPAARATNTLTKDLGAAAAQQAQAETTTTTPEQTVETTTQRAPRPVTQQPTATTQQETQQAPPSTTTPAPSSSTQQTTTPPPPSTTTPPPPPSSSSQSPSSSTPPPSSTPPSSATPSTPPSDDGSGLGLDLDLGGILNPIGGFDFFAPAG